MAPIRVYDSSSSSQGYDLRLEKALPQDTEWGSPVSPAKGAWKFPSRRGGPPQLALNRQALDAVNEALGKSIGGAQMNPEQADAVATRIEGHADDLHGRGVIRAGTAEHLRAFGGAIRSNGAASGAILHLSDRSVPLTRRAQILLEEHLHARQSEIEGDRRKEAVVQASVVLHPAFKKARAALAQHPQYPNPSTRTAVNETTAKIAAGLHDEVGLTFPEGRSILKSYLAAIEQQHSANAARRIIDHADTQGKLATRATRERRVQTEVQRRSPAPGSPGTAGEGVRSLEEGRGQGSDQAVTSEPGGEPPDQGPQYSTGQPSLFDAGEQDRLARESAADRDKLTGERLTAQFKAPLTRAEQKLKPGEKPPQTSLFESTPEKPQLGLFGDERGGVPALSDLARFLQKQFHQDGPKANYSGLGALQDKYVRNLSQLEKANPVAHASAVRAASSKAQAAVMLRGAVPAIEKALQGSGFTWEDLRHGLIESRLRGVRERWLDLADQAKRQNGVGLHKAFENGLSGLLEVIEGKRGFPQDLQQTAATLLEPGANPLTNQTGGPDYATLRDFLTQTFTDAAKRVDHMMDGPRFEEMQHTPQVLRLPGVTPPLGKVAS